MGDIGASSFLSRLALGLTWVLVSSDLPSESMDGSGDAGLIRSSAGRLFIAQSMLLVPNLIGTGFISTVEFGTPMGIKFALSSPRSFLSKSGNLPNARRASAANWYS